jgi:hypothetical protein
MSSSKKISVRKVVTFSAAVLLGLFSFSSTGYAEKFPSSRAARDTSDILDYYQTYLDFVLQVGRNQDAESTNRLEKTFAKLKKSNPEAAARFLKGLRFEMVDKAERMGRREVSLNANNSELRKWVGRFISDWAREADEHWYRVYSSQIAKR